MDDKTRGSKDNNHAPEYLFLNGTHVWNTQVGCEEEMGKGREGGGSQMSAWGNAKTIF